MVKKVQMKVTTVGGAGVAAGSATTQDPIMGKIVRIAVNYNASTPGTTDLTLVEANEQVQQLILNLANQDTDLNLYPQHVVDQNDGTDWLYVAGEEVSDYYYVADELTLTVAQCDALTDAVVVDIYYEE